MVGAMSAKDMMGLRFGQLTVIQRAGTSRRREALWLFSAIAERAWSRQT
jgi:hypothetical protein